MISILTNNNVGAGGSCTIQSGGTDLIPDTLTALTVLIGTAAGTFSDDTNTAVIPAKTAFNVLYTEQDNTIVTRGTSVMGTTS